MSALARLWRPAAQAALVAALGWLPGLATAQVGFDSPPRPASPQALELPEFRQSRLPNGLGLAVVERHRQPLVTAMLLLQTGAVYDPPGKAGLAELSVAMMGKGVQRGAVAVPAAELAAAVEGLGTQLEIGSGARSSQLGVTVASNRLDASLGLLAEMLRSPSLSEEEFARMQAQAADALKLGRSDPAQLAAQVARRLYWGDSPQGRQATPATLARIQLDDVRAFHRLHLRPDRVTLILAGDIDPAQARALADKHFGKWRAPRTALPQMPALAPKPLATKTVLVDLPGAGQSAVLVMAPAAAPSPVPLAQLQPETQALEVVTQQANALANTVLGVGYSSRINQEVRIKRGLSYGAASGIEALPGGAVLITSAQTKHESAGEVAALMQQEIRRMAAERVPDPELVARRAVLIGEFGRQLETTAGLAGLAADGLIRGRPLAELSRVPEELAALDGESTRLLASRHWQAERLRTVIVADFKQGGLALRQQFPDALLLKAEEVDLASPTLKRGGRK
ncbi:M16 family metallopeptidase [Paucibacter sp. DJ2R-2]|uniref:M16 family metallopeptidase n=1 Tax=Paucibacter sp. DJ2R-2 TaxID=2893558 RepID=UPI0021E3B64A|nr:pitrilysin family protein [Paucibacter sp. DJ2R-2]MCV2421147.1 insulinase family protein [Paucibacter sp. DJ4R-1]MCV2439125.1 insulinase family protein [Paucibacter sp. DJ2R-2]